MVGGRESINIIPSIIPKFSSQLCMGFDDELYGRL